MSAGELNDPEPRPSPLLFSVHATGATNAAFFPYPIKRTGYFYA
jgi:hypothetical protein